MKSGRGTAKAMSQETKKGTGGGATGVSFMSLLARCTGAHQTPAALACLLAAQSTATFSALPHSVQEASYELVMKPKDLQSQLVNHETLEEPAAILYSLRFPRCWRLFVISCATTLTLMQLSPLQHSLTMTQLRPIAADPAPAHRKETHIKCITQALSGAVVAEMFVFRQRPWLVEIPFGRARAPTNKPPINVR